MATDKHRLIQILNTTFNQGELRTLAFDLNISFDDLTSGGKTNIVNEIVEFAERRGRLEDLAAYVKKLRPDQNLATVESKRGINTNIGNIGMEGNVTIGQSIHSNKISGSDFYVEKNREEEKKQFRDLLAELRESIETCVHELPGERELVYALENVEELQTEMSQDHPRPSLLFHRLEDTNYILETTLSSKPYSGKYLAEIEKARRKSGELLRLTKKLA